MVPRFAKKARTPAMSIATVATKTISAAMEIRGSGMDPSGE
jgi:hypothetical protein